MMNLFSVILLSMFTIRPLTSTYIYVDLNQPDSLKIEFINDDIERNIVFHFYRISTPEGLEFMQCVRGMCYFSDSIQLNVQPNFIDTIKLDFFAGGNPGPIQAYYKVYDVQSAQDRDSVYISGQVPVFEKGGFSLYFKNGFLYGDDIREVWVYDVQGNLIKFLKSTTPGPISIPLGRGVYFLHVETNRGPQAIKVVNVR